jgi:hypothetical protein
VIIGPAANANNTRGEATAGMPTAGTLATKVMPEMLETLKAGRTSTAVRTTATAEILASSRIQGR